MSTRDPIKSLHLATSVADLNKLAFESKNSNVKSSTALIKSLDRLQLEAKNKEIEGDLETAYVYAIRFCTLYQNFVSTAKKEDKEYAGKVMGPKVSQEISRAEKLRKTLSEYYTELENEKNRPPSPPPPPPSEPIESTVNKVELTNGNNNNIVPISQTIWISPTDLYKLIKSTSTNSLLIFDVRDVQEFSACHIQFKNIINIPPRVWEFGYTLTAINKHLQSDSNASQMWNKRGEFDKIAMIDWASSQKEINFDDNRSNHPLCLLHRALLKWDSQHLIKNSPLCLCGGLKEFLLRYPTYVTDPSYDNKTSQNNIHKEIRLEDFNKLNYSVFVDDDDSSGSSSTDEEVQRNQALLLALNKQKQLQQKPKQPQQQQQAQHDGSSSSSLVYESFPPDSSSSSSNDTFTNPPMVDRSSKPQKVANSNIPAKNGQSKLFVSPEVFTTPTSPAQKITLEQHLQPSKQTKVQIESPNIDFSAMKPFTSNSRLSYEAPSRINSSLASPLPKVAIVSPKDALSQSKPGHQLNLPFAAVKNTDLSPGSTPPEWMKIHDTQTNRYYYFNRLTGQKSLIPPEQIFSTSFNKSPPTAVVATATAPLPSSVPTTTSAKVAVVPPLVEASQKPKPVVKEAQRTPEMGTLRRTSSQPSLDRLIKDVSPQVADTSTVPPLVPPSITQKPATGEVPPPVVRSNKPKLESQNQRTSQINIQTLDAQQLRKLEPHYGNPGSGLTGLRNLGNTCYMNSVLQALFNTRLFMDFFLKDKYIQDINPTNPLGFKGEMVRSFVSIMRAVWCNHYKEISPRDFKTLVDKSGYVFTGNDQQDSQEFLLFVLDGLHEDLNQVRQRNQIKALSDEFVDSLPDVEYGNISWQRHLAFNKSIIVDNFQGQFKSTLTCCTCGKRSVTFDAFMYLSLPIAQRDQCSLKQCVEVFLREEKMTGECQWRCPKCKVNRDAIKKIDLWKLPPILIIHLKRFSSLSSSKHQKLNTAVDFPINNLNLSSYVRGPSSLQPYNLYAVTNHYGRMEGGHYKSHCLNHVNNRWYLFDDAQVHSAVPRDVVTSAAYILFYEM